MLTCTQCHADVPDGMRFCLQCGAPLAESPRPASPALAVEPVAAVAAPMESASPVAPVPAARPRPPREVYPTFPTVNLKIAPTPVLSPRDGGIIDHQRPSLGDPRLEIDEVALRKAFEKPAQPGAVVCRFCKGPLDLEGDFCEQCGAPVIEAAPAGSLKPKTAPPGEGPSAAAAPLFDEAPQAGAQAGAPMVQVSGLVAQSDPPPAGGLLFDADLMASPPPSPVDSVPLHPAVAEDPASAPVMASAPEPSNHPHSEEHHSGLMGRLKGLFKKS